jgi:hypothetical protein
MPHDSRIPPQHDAHALIGTRAHKSPHAIPLTPSLMGGLSIGLA